MKYYSPSAHGNRRFYKSGVDAVDWNRIEGVGCIATNVHHDGQLPLRPRCDNLILCYKGRYLTVEIDAVDEDVDVENFLERATLGGFV
jgi:hypothetical protein